jgi:hypothetical protein
MLQEPTQKYVNHVFNSWNFLNCPKHMFNHDLDCLYLQGIVISKETAIKYVEEHLQRYGNPNPHSNAVFFVAWRDKLTMAEFMTANVNKYIDNTPPHIEALNKKINDWTDANTTYYSAIYGGVKDVPTYQFPRN